ncbi:MAG: hypothetical protein IJW94_07100 [Oscillospiraceae bacterium]|nr:hypothetical protein [Oscillospiraceae bacterium]
MPKSDGTMYPWERAELHQANVRYQNAVNKVKMHPNSAGINEADEKKAFADLMRITAKYAGCK